MKGQTLSVFQKTLLRSDHLISIESFPVSNASRGLHHFVPALVSQIGMVIISIWSSCQQGPNGDPYATA